MTVAMWAGVVVAVALVLLLVGALLSNRQDRKRSGGVD